MNSVHIDNCEVSNTVAGELASITGMAEMYIDPQGLERDLVVEVPIPELMASTKILSKRYLKTH